MPTLLALALVGATVLAQERPTFRVSTRLVQVSVVVQDREGRAVTGLSAKDFQLFDGGVEQRIELFAAESGPGVAADETPPATAPQAAGNVFTNRVTARGSVTVILFDRLNTPAADQMYARTHLLGFLRQIRSDDRIGIYVLEGATVRVLHDFSNDARSLVRAVARYDAATSREVAAIEDPLSPGEKTGIADVDAKFQAALDSLSARITEHFNGIRSNATVAAFQAIASRLAGIEGRKNLIWITAAFPLDAFTVRGISRSSEIQRATRPLNDANVALYAVDARGLIGAFTFGPRGVPVMTTLSSVRTNLDIMQIAAEETGGRAFYSTNDIQRSVRRAVDDSRVTYTLGYYPSHGKWDGTYRQIKVKTARPGLQLRHRRGYVAGANARQAESLRAGAVGAAIESPLEATGIPITAAVEPVAGAPGQVKISVRADAGSITFTRAGEEWTGTLNLVIAQKLADGKTRKDIDRTLELRIRQDRYEEIRTRGFSIDVTTTLHADTQRLHIIMQDAETGSTGSIVVTRDKLMPTRH